MVLFIKDMEGIILFLFASALLVSLFVLIRYGRVIVGRCVGLLALKSLLFPVMVVLLNALGSIHDTYAFLIFPPDFFLILFLGYHFVGLLKKDRSITLFFVGDVVRWLSLLVVFVLPNPFPEPYFYTQLYVWFFFILIFPFLYTVSGLVIVRKHLATQNLVY